MRALSVPVRLALLAAIGALVVPRTSAARGSRPRFEPTDLELQESGSVELDVQAGAATGDGPSGSRLLLPDFELAVGLSPQIQLEVDGAFSLDEVDTPRRRFVGEPLWTGVKLGILDTGSGERGADTWAVGLQLGPRVPTMASARGLGFESVALLGYVHRRLHVVLNAGGLVDPGDAISSGRPVDLIAGVDVVVDLDDRGRWSALGQVGAIYSLGPDPSALSTAVGAAFAASKSLDLTAMILVGALPGTDRVAFLLGAAPRFAIW